LGLLKDKSRNALKTVWNLPKKSPEQFQICHFALSVKLMEPVIAFAIHVFCYSPLSPSSSVLLNLLATCPTGLESTIALFEIGISTAVLNSS
jgi:hypothetical protein